MEADLHGSYWSSNQINLALWKQTSLVWQFLKCYSVKNFSHCFLQADGSLQTNQPYSNPLSSTLHTSSINNNVLIKVYKRYGSLFGQQTDHSDF